MHLATITPSILAPAQLAKPPLLRSWHGTWNKSHWPWNVKSTMRKARSSPTQTWILCGKLKATYNFAASLFCAAQSLFRNILQCCSWMSQSCNSCAGASAVEIWAEMGQITSTAWKNNLCTLLLCFCTFNTGTCAVSKTRVASKTSKTTTASWLAWNLKQIPLALKCQINNEKSQILPNTNVDPTGKNGGCLQRRGFTFLHGPF